MLKTIEWWKHQVAEFNWMLERECGILNAGMGTGKTFVTLAYINHMRFSKVLIVTTGKGVDVWKDEIADKLTKHPPVVDDNHLTIKQQADNFPTKTPYVYVTTYARLWRPFLLQVLLKAKFDCIVLDESHKIAGNNSKVSKACWALSRTAKYRFGLTGTLLTNNPLNLFGQARFIDEKMFNSPETPKLLNSFTRFRAYFCHLKPLPGIMGAYIITGYKNMDFYECVLNKYVYRVDSDKVLDLPEAIHKYVKVYLPSDVKGYYRQIAQDGFTKYGKRVVVADNVLVTGTRLHQIAGGFITTTDPQGNPKETEVSEIHTEKLKALVELIEGLNETEPIVIFAKYTPEIFAIARETRKFGGVSILSGQRDELKSWQAGKTRIIVVQTETGSEAIDLSRAAYTFIYSTGWQLGNYEQMLRRMRRPRKDGTKVQTVYYYHLITSGTIDMDIAKALTDKKKITNEVLSKIIGYNHEKSNVPSAVYTELPEPEPA